jgi:UDP-glucose 4-epimerase
METKPNLLVLGNRGFIGAALYSYLKGNNNLEVKGFNSSNLDLISPNSIRQIEKVVDENTVVIFTVRAPKNLDPLKAFEQDIAITCNIARFLKNSLIKKFLYFSSISVYGDGATNLCINEQTKNAPSSYYGISKTLGEEVLRKATQEKGIPFTVLRPCMVYGPGNTELPYGPNYFLHSLMDKGQLELFGDGSELRDFLFLEDLVKLTEKFIFSHREGIYNLGTGNSSSLLNIVEILRKITKRDCPIIRLKRNRPKIDQKLDISKLLDLFQNYTFTPLEEGLRKSYENFLRDQDHKNLGVVN